ncbi:hypothetical protein AMTR_s01770p00008690, partial [Amborella trichopoda]
MLLRLSGEIVERGRAVVVVSVEMMQASLRMAEKGVGLDKRERERGVMAKRSQVAAGVAREGGNGVRREGV